MKDKRFLGTCQSNLEASSYNTEGKELDELSNNGLKVKGLVAGDIEDVRKCVGSKEEVEDVLTLEMKRYAGSKEVDGGRPV